MIIGRMTSATFAIRRMPPNRTGAQRTIRTSAVFILLSFRFLSPSSAPAIVFGLHHIEPDADGEDEQHREHDPSRLRIPVALLDVTRRRAPKAPHRASAP